MHTSNVHPYMCIFPYSTSSIHRYLSMWLYVYFIYHPKKSDLDSGCRDPDVWKVLCFVHGFCPPTRQVSLFRSLDLIARSVDELQILGNKAIDLVPLGTVACWLNGHSPAVTSWIQLIDTYFILVVTHPSRYGISVWVCLQKWETELTKYLR